MSSQLTSTHLISCFLSFFHLISPHLISYLPFLAQLVSADHNCSNLFSCHLSFSHLSSSRLFSDFHSSSQKSQLSAAHLMSSHLFSPLLTSSQLFWHLLSSSQRRLKSCQFLSHPKPAPKTDLSTRASDPYIFTEENREAFTCSKLLHREACTDREAVPHKKLLHAASFYTETLT